MHGAIVGDVVAEQVTPHAAAQAEPVKELQVCVRIQADVTEQGVEVALSQIRVPSSRRIMLLDATYQVPARKIAELDVLWLVECLPMPARRATRANRGFLHCEIDHVPALVMQALQGLLHVEQETRKVFKEAQAAVGQKQLLRERRVGRA